MQLPAKTALWRLVTLGLFMSAPVWAETKHIDIVVAGSKAQKTIHAELAITFAERQKGLMHRKALLPDSGMLFVFPDEKILKFWMKDTYIPLDILFFDKDGVLTNKIDNVPPLTLTNRVSTKPAIYALEVAGKASETWDLGRKIHLKLPLASP